MQQLLAFLYGNRAFFAFIGLQMLCAWLVVNRNSYQSYAFVSSSSRVMGSIYSVTDGVADYFNLEEVNAQLKEENARLRRANGRQRSGPPTQIDSSFFANYEYVPAQVINNSIHFDDNYLTLDKGSKHGIEPGMGVITSNGIVGKVKACSENFSSVYSLLHSEMLVSSELKKSNTLCTTIWDSQDHQTANLRYLSRQTLLKTGDSVVTSGNNSVFPPQVLIGRIRSFEKLKSESFMKAEIELSTDFSQLDYVYIVKNRLVAEKDSLEQISQ